jgi:hypothetical protein
MLNSWERQIAYCQKYCELLSKKDQQFVNDLSGREPTPSRIRHLNAVTVAIQRDPRSSGGERARPLKPAPRAIRAPLALLQALTVTFIAIVSLLKSFSDVFIGFNLRGSSLSPGFPRVAERAEPRLASPCVERRHGRDE